MSKFEMINNKKSLDYNNNSIEIRMNLLQFKIKIKF